MRITEAITDSQSLPAEAAKPRLEVNDATVPGGIGASLPAVGRWADDSAAISETASLVFKTMSLPEMNATRVSDVQQALATGRFQVDPDHVATALIRTMLEGS